ncbi:MAG: adenylate/guanylate cyclase domain-containing protein [Pseudomonadota bacterium]
MTAPANTARHRRNAQLTALIAGVSLFIGAGIGLLQAAPDARLTGVAVGGLMGVTIAVGCTLSDLYIFSNAGRRWTRRLPPVRLLALRALTYSAVILVALALPGVLSDAPPLWRDPDIPRSFAIAAAIAVLVSTGVELNRLLGPEATRGLLTGRYSRPQIEDRVVLIADVVGSTALAERIGDLEFHSFLQEVAYDLAEPIYATRGNVHAYVGDATIVTWPLDQGLADGACLNCARAMHGALAEAAPRYQARFGSAAALRIAIHAGPVAAGEMGDWKIAIALLGDTMNTAARLEGAARVNNVGTVLSDVVASGLPDAARGPLRALPDFTAAGKGTALTLWAA